MSSEDVAAVMRPHPPHTLGWFCLGYNSSDVLGRAALIGDLLRHVGLPDSLCSEHVVSQTLSRLLSLAPHWIRTDSSAFASLRPSPLPSEAPNLLSRLCQEYVPCTIAVCCGTRMLRWKLLSTICYTLARGVLPGKIVCLRCAKCGSVYAGGWRWRSVPAHSAFPDGFHTAFYVGLPQSQVRWFFAPGAQDSRSLPLHVATKDTPGRLRRRPLRHALGLGRAGRGHPVCLPRGLRQCLGSGCCGLCA